MVVVAYYYFLAIGRCRATKLHVVVCDEADFGIEQIITDDNLKLSFDNEQQGEKSNIISIPEFYHSASYTHF